MHLIVELSGEDRSSADAGARTLELHTIAAALRSPRRVRGLLRDRRYDRVEIRRGELPLSAVQALALLAVSIVQTRRWQLDERVRGRASFAVYAAVTATLALARELVLSGTAAIKLMRAARRRYAIPRSTTETSSCVYLRVEPSLGWMGAQVGGAATHTSGVVSGLTAIGVRVHVVASERPPGTDQASFSLVRPRRRLELVRGLGYTDFSDAVAAAASEQDADFVYQRYQLGSYAGLEVARRLGVPLVLEYNGPEIWVERHWRSGRRLLLEAPLERLEQHHLHEASLIVVVSEALRDLVLARGVLPDRVLVNPNGVDVDRLEPYRERTPARWRQTLGLPDVATIGFIGTFGRWHGVELLPELIAEVPDARWILIGGGGLFDEVRDEIETRDLAARVTMSGVVPHESALRMLACCDVCVSPHVPNPDGTPFFGSPTKLFEYMGLAKPIVASDLDQIGAVIQDGETGLLCPPGDVAAAAAATRRLLADEALRARLGANALERARTQHSWRAHAQRTLGALRAGGSIGAEQAVASVAEPSP
jgi:glycosyltransferase involved in cell wall biosynthesis